MLNKQNIWIILKAGQELSYHLANCSHDIICSHVVIVVNEIH
jgi:hypothetical protein